MSLMLIIPALMPAPESFDICCFFFFFLAASARYIFYAAQIDGLFRAAHGAAARRGARVCAQRYLRAYGRVRVRYVLLVLRACCEMARDERVMIAAR